ncbi:DNA-directed RNA polymerase I subunit RPA34 [Austrofundulus limnaeus]|uniref:DNA-directed RNA polymerase I subunit RPA34 n=1 Tax=Austrofundulus limnaeus TaxID=52670 RepID=A0A2I4BUM4_AUSLI|nr:PREDICTED: DNA-directed RNA polymerase I subunit RPA34 [Austrofundulus limnaeus]XP_013871419.1 PREDICTED: DNA-directed RNA polymerase I subunit RPA34 [Austrofundulus limnaeus]
MPKDVSSSSSSSSEDEAENPAASESTETNNKTTKFECPQDFVSFRHVPCRSTLTDSLRNGENELWLIKAPHNFNPESFRGVKLPLSGLQTLKVPSPAGTQQVYSVLASSRCSSELRLLTSDGRASDGATFGPEFSGLLNVCESYGGGGGANCAPRVIPAAPPPSIPAGLKQRFHPFGSKTPTLTYVAEDEADGAAFGPSSTTLRPLVMKRFSEEAAGEDDEDDEDDEDARRKKKKKKKEKRMKLEQMEDIIKVKQEPKDPFQESESPAEKIKKKKKKKKEREEVEEGLEPSVTVKEEEVPVKCEPSDAQYDDSADIPAKKKKKKKKRTDED